MPRTSRPFDNMSKMEQDSLLHRIEFSGRPKEWIDLMIGFLKGEPATSHADNETTLIEPDSVATALQPDHNEDLGFFGEGVYTRRR